MRTFASLIVLVYTLSIFLPFAQPVYAQASTTTHKSRLTIPVNKLSTLVIEKGDKEVNKRLLVSDYLSSTKAIMSGNGTVENYPAYYPYGLPKSDLDQNLTDKYYTQQKKVTADSSVYNYNARYYNPMTGIFIQPDSVKGPNRYFYADNDPSMLNDPRGECPMCIGALIGGGLDLAIQVLGEGKKLEEVNWASVAISAAGGAVGAGIGANIAKMAATSGAKLALAATADWAVGTATTVAQKEYDGHGNLIVNIESAAISNIAGAAFGQAGQVAGKGMAVATKKIGSVFGFGGRNIITVSDVVGDFIVDQKNDKALGRFLTDLEAYVWRNRTNNTVSRLDLVVDFIQGRMRYSIPDQQAIYAAHNGMPSLGEFCTAGVGVCKEYAALTHLGLEAVGYDSHYMTGHAKSGHAWVEVVDNATGEPFVVDSTWGRRAEKGSFYEDYAARGASGEAHNFLGRIERSKLTGTAY